MIIQFIGPTYQSRALAVDTERVINWFPELISPAPPEGSHGASPQTRYAFYPTPGKRPLLQFDDGPGACIVPSEQTWNGTTTPVAYAISGSTLYYVTWTPGATVLDGTATATTIGTVSERVIANTGGQLFPAQILVLGQDALGVCANGGFYVAGRYAITTSTLSAGGTGYAVGDTGRFAGGGIGGTYIVDTVDAAGAVLTYTVTYGGFNYRVMNNVDTINAGSQPGSGIGFQINITAVSSSWVVLQYAIPNGSLTSDNFIQTITYIHGYVIATIGTNQDPEKRRFYVSALNDATDWDPLDFGTKEQFTDPLYAGFSSNQLLMLMGQQTTELWQDTGAVDFPFSLVTGGIIEAGIASPWAIAKIEDTIVWLAADMRGALCAFQLRGQTPVRISNHAVEYAWRNYDATGSSAYTYQENGHFFWCVHFPIPDATWVWDSTTNMWHERLEWDGSTWHADMSRYHAFAYPVGHLTLDYTSGNLYQQSIDFCTANCNSIRRLRIAPQITNRQKWSYFWLFRLHMETGKVGPFDNPLVNLRISPDGGYTWGPYKVQSAGLIGQYDYKVEWWRLGRNRNAAFEITTEMPCPCLVDAYVGVHEGGGPTGPL